MDRDEIKSIINQFQRDEIDIEQSIDLILAGFEAGKQERDRERLVTLEAKIEVIKELVENLKNRLYNPVKAGDYWSQEWLKWLIKDLTESNHYESELAELVKELSL